MYQWKESSNKQTNKWSSKLFDSGNFEGSEQKNPSSMIESKLFETRDFVISNFIFSLNENESITQPELPIYSLLKYGKLMKRYDVKLNGQQGKMKEDHSESAWYYFSNSSDQSGSADIGDIRARFWLVSKPLSLTVIGKQNGQSVSLLSNTDDISVRCIGKYELKKALKRLFRVKLINKDTGSIFMMTNIALCCCLYAGELLKELLSRDPNDADCDRQRENSIGLKALIGSSMICGPTYCLSVAYPYIDDFYCKHPQAMLGSMGAVALAAYALLSKKSKF